MHHVRERGHTRTIFCFMTTEMARSGFLVFPKHYLHLLKKLMQLRFVLIFVTKYFHKVKNITEIMIKIYQQHRRPSISYFVLFSLVN